MNKIHNYGFWGSVYILFCLVITKLFFRKSRIIRFPIDIRCKKHVDFGFQLTTGKYCRIESLSPRKSDKTIIFGTGIEINDFVHIAAKERVSIGDNVLIASKVFISDCSHGQYTGDQQSPPYERAGDRKITSQPVSIEENVWLGDNVVVLPGVTIGKNSIIGASSVVSKSIPENCIAVGIPAKVVKVFNEEKQQWIPVAK